MTNIENKTSPDSAVSRLVILLNTVSLDVPDLAQIPFRYASTAAAMDFAVEIHAVSHSVTLFRRGAKLAGLDGQIKQAFELGVDMFVCPVALAQAGMTELDLVPEVSGVRGAASLLVAGFAPGSRFMVF